MAKETKKLLFVIVFLSTLLIFSAYAPLTPNVHAAEVTAQQNGLEADYSSNLKYPEPCTDISKFSSPSDKGEIVYAPRYEAAEQEWIGQHYGTRLYNRVGFWPWEYRYIYGVYAGHEVDENIDVSNDFYIYAPTSRAPNYASLELGTMYHNHIKQFFVYNFIDNHWLRKDIDSTFLSKYTRNFGGKQMYFVESIKLNEWWYALLYNFNTESWDLLETEPASETVHLDGWSYWEMKTLIWPLGLP